MHKFLRGQPSKASIEMKSMGVGLITKADDRYSSELEVRNRTLQQRESWLSHFSGWRGGVLSSITISASVLLLNIILLTLATTKWNPKKGIATSYTGDCDMAGKLTTVTHLFINVLSSLLLGASNYCMQRLVAPTRNEVDKAHAKRKRLDIGIPSVRNLFHISKFRVILWLLLALSSVPLHLFYNSVVFQTIGSQHIDSAIVSHEFFTKENSFPRDIGKWQIDYKILRFQMNYDAYKIAQKIQSRVLEGKYKDPTIFSNLTSADCFDKYTAPHITNSGTLLAVVKDEARQKLAWNDSSSVQVIESDYTFVDNAGRENMTNYIAYCLEEKIKARCEIQFSISLLSIVIACNAGKVILMAIILFCFNEKTLVTIGDAIDSFLRRCDPTTEKWCIATKDNIWKRPVLQPKPRWKPRSWKRWLHACSWRRWFASLLLYFVALFAAIRLYKMSREGMSKGSIGFGEINEWNFISLEFKVKSIIPLVLIANSPQVIVSFLYITYNGLFTCMLTEREWTQYSRKQAPLRVTIPSIGQRSTYFLQLPFLWSTPLLVGSALLHWFISQAIFLTRIAEYDHGLRVDDGSPESFDGITSRLGYSDQGILASFLLGMSLVVTILVVAFVFKYPSGPPLGASCSAIISAACHVGSSEGSYQREAAGDDIANKPLMWGVTIEGSQMVSGHCSFSAEIVTEPIKGHQYE